MLLLILTANKNDSDIAGDLDASYWDLTKKVDNIHFHCLTAYLDHLPLPEGWQIFNTIYAWSL